MMKLYAISDWNKYFENNRSRTVKLLGWVAVPNRHDGEHYSAIMSHPKAAEIFTAWNLMLQVASKCDPRGVLVKGNGSPHTAVSLAAKTRGRVEWFDLALEFLPKHTDWIEVSEVDGDQAPPIPQKHRNGTVYSPESRVLVHLLNELTGKKFRESSESLEPIQARLNEADVDLEGCKKMIHRQVKMWKSDPKMNEYLRPQTLFAPTNFNSYYAAKDLPVGGVVKKSYQP